MASPVSFPRALPLTIVGLSALLVFKSVTLVHAASAALQTSSDAPVTGQAQDTPPPAPVAPQQSERPAVPLRPSVSVQATAPTPAPELAEELARQRNALATTQRDADAQAGLLAAARAKLATDLSDLESRRKSLESAETSKVAMDSGNWDDLAKMYEDMGPKSAANIFNVVDLHVLLHILERMNVRKASAVLAAMDPERAKLATQMLALRKAPPHLSDAAASVPAPDTAASGPTKDDAK